MARSTRSEYLRIIATTVAFLATFAHDDGTDRPRASRPPPPKASPQSDPCGVFVTAYNQYAIAAFRARRHDYVKVTAERSRRMAPAEVAGSGQLRRKLRAWPRHSQQIYRAHLPGAADAAGAPLDAQPASARETGHRGRRCRRNFRVRHQVHPRDDRGRRSADSQNRCATGSKPSIAEMFRQITDP